MRHNSFKAFTILELLVGMILSGIVLTATFTAYRVTLKQFQSYSERSATLTEISFFTSQLEADFEKAKMVKRISENVMLLESEKTALEYRFTDKYVLRNNFLQTDTFHVTIAGTETFMKSGKVIADDAETDELHVWLNMDGKQEEKIYRKETDPKTELDKLRATLH